MWIQKWIHIAVYAVPFSAACYLLTLDAFNPVVRSCHFVSIPLGCGDESVDGTPCVRGPQNIALLQNWFFVIPFLFIFLFPASIMAVVYIQVRFFRGERGRDVATSVAKQSGLYLLVLYWTYGFKIVDAALVNRMGKYIFVTNLLATLVESLHGVWVLCSYLYFRSDKVSPIVSSQHQRQPTKGDGDDEIIDGIMNPSATFTMNGSSHLIIGKGQVSGRHSHSSKNSPTIERRFCKPEFSIFDGTDVGVSDSPWAAFLVDEYEDESYKANCEYDDTDIHVVSESHRSKENDSAEEEQEETKN